MPDTAPLQRPRTLTEAQLASYHERGYAFPVPALTADEARDYLAKIEAFELAHGGRLGGWPRALSHKPHIILTWLDELVRHPCILDAVQDIVGPDILCWSSRFFIKDANDGGFVSWHQDLDRKSTRLNSSHVSESRMPSSA